MRCSGSHTGCASLPPIIFARVGVADDTRQGAYAEYIVSPATHLIAKPAHLSWIEASSIPENYLTAFQALIVLAELKKGQNVLIHAGASGVGIAAIQLARMYGA